MTNEINFLKSFFLLFDAKIETFSALNKEVVGTVYWEGETDKQQFSWESSGDKDDLLQATLLCNYLKTKRFVDNDKILIPEGLLLAELKKDNWSQNVAKNAINFVCSVEVHMLDDGIKTDSFYLHF